MKFTFSTPNHERSAACGLPPVFTVEADSEAEAREQAMLERHGHPRGKLAALGVHKWTGQGLNLEDGE
jgi:hypothetical protein